MLRYIRYGCVLIVPLCPVRHGVCSFLLPSVEMHLAARTCAPPGLKELGLFRQSGRMQRTKELQEQFDKGKAY